MQKQNEKIKHFYENRGAFFHALGPTKSFEKRIYRKVRPGTAPGDFN